jgi:hypothetical protein
MRTRTKIVNSKIIKTTLGDYHRALETLHHIYFVNFDESDENASVKMFNRNREIVSDNYFAYQAFMEDIENKQYTWMSEKLKECLDKSK